MKLLNEKKLHQTENLYLDFESPEKASQIVKLKHFKKFQDTTEALAAATATIEGKMSKALKSLMKKVVAKEAHEELAVADAKLGNVIKDKFDVSCVANSSVQELLRGIRQQMDSLISLPEKEMSAMALGLAHSLSRYKLKFSPDKVDTMIVQAISLLDDLDKELNNYVMRAREWYGWHFPEMGKIIADNLAYARIVMLMGFRTNASTTDFSKVLPEEMEQEVKDAAEISMGTEISDEDLLNVKYLCEQPLNLASFCDCTAWFVSDLRQVIGLRITDKVIEISVYRTQLYDYIKNRMMAVAPNLTVLVGELVGARLISHAGSLMNLAKHPASTVQILGAEKALFRALKTKHDTPKYGLIYHAQLVGQANLKIKGKMSRMLAAKCALAIRCDALGEETNADLGLEHRATLERRMRQLEEGKSRRISGTGKAQAKWEKYENKSQIRTYNDTADSTLPNVPRKRKFGDDEEDNTPHKTPRMDPVVKSEPEIGEEEGTEKKKKKKKKKERQDSTTLDTTQESIGSPEAGGGSEKKKKKKKKIKAEPDSD